MYLSQNDAGPGSGPNAVFFARAFDFVRKSALWIGGFVFAILATIGTFFFALTAIIGTFILAGLIAFFWFLFKTFGAKKTAMHDFPHSGADANADDPQTLNATRGPKGWTVDDTASRP